MTEDVGVLSCSPGSGKKERWGSWVSFDGRVFSFFFNAQFQMETKQHLHELSMGNHWESTQSILPHAEFRCDEAKIEESEKAGSCRESNPGHLWPQA